MMFLKEAKAMVRYNLCSPDDSRKCCFVTGTVQKQQNSSRVDNEALIKHKVATLPCLACSRSVGKDSSSSKHNMRSCLTWGGLSHKERLSLVKCVKHPFAKDDHTIEECQRSIGSCMYCKRQDDHNSMLCPNFQVK